MQNIRDLTDMHQQNDFQVNIILKENLKLNNIQLVKTANNLYNNILRHYNGTVSIFLGGRIYSCGS